MEIWKDIPNYIGQYQASNSGKVRSLDRFTEQLGRCGKPYKRFIKGRVLAQKFCKANGYFMLCFPKKKTMTVHRAIALAFHPNPLGLKEVNHKNGIKTDNGALNLEWTSSSKNRQHAFANGLQKNSIAAGLRRRGSNNATSKLDEATVIQLLADYKTIKSQRRTAKKYGITKTTAASIINGKTWRHVQR